MNYGKKIHICLDLLNISNTNDRSFTCGSVSTLLKFIVFVFCFLFFSIFSVYHVAHAHVTQFEFFSFRSYFCCTEHFQNIIHSTRGMKLTDFIHKKLQYNMSYNTLRVCSIERCIDEKRTKRGKFTELERGKQFPSTVHEKRSLASRLWFQSFGGSETFWIPRNPKKRPFRLYFNSMRLFYFRNMIFSLFTSTAQLNSFVLYYICLPFLLIQHNSNTFDYKSSFVFMYIHEW